MDVKSLVPWCRGGGELSKSGVAQACFVSALCLLPAAAFAQRAPISPEQALAAEGQNVAVEGIATVTESVGMPGLLVRLKRYGSDASIAGYIAEGTENRFPDLNRLDGKDVEMSGVVEEMEGRPMILLNSGDQLRIMPPG